MSDSAPETNSDTFMQRRRAFVACTNCRRRKIKCATLLDGECRPCTRCVAKGLKCEYVVADELSPPPTTVACKACRRSKIKCATVSDGNCRPCTQCKQKGLQCEYPEPNKYLSFQSSSTSRQDDIDRWDDWIPQSGQTEVAPQFFGDNRDGWPPPIALPSAGINTYLTNMPHSSRGLNPMPHGQSSRTSQAHPGMMPPVPFPLQPPPNHSSRYTPPHPSLPNVNAPPQYYGASPNSIDTSRTLNQAYGQAYASTTEQQVPNPSMWPHASQSFYDPRYNPNTSDFNRRSA